MHASSDSWCIGHVSCATTFCLSDIKKSTLLTPNTRQWQMWTAFGIMVGYAADLAFYSVSDRPGITGLDWRLMMGSAMLPAVIVCCFVLLCPESPRWYMSKGRYSNAYESMCRLRSDKIQAARDVFYMYTLLEAEKGSVMLGHSKVKEMITVPRNRRAMQASEIVMFMQQVRCHTASSIIKAPPTQLTD